MKKALYNVRKTLIILGFFAVIFYALYRLMDRADDWSKEPTEQEIKSYRAAVGYN